MPDPSAERALKVLLSHLPSEKVKAVLYDLIHKAEMPVAVQSYVKGLLELLNQKPGGYGLVKELPDQPERLV